MTMIALPAYDEWMGSPEWRDHLGNHGAPWHEPMPKSEGCPACAVSLFLPAIHEVWLSGDKTAAHIIWSLQDGYGAEGFTPTQGLDWSGVRDSSPAAIHRIAEALGLTPEGT